MSRRERLASLPAPSESSAPSGGVSRCRPRAAGRTPFGGPLVRSRGLFQALARLFAPPPRAETNLSLPTANLGSLCLAPLPCTRLPGMTRASREKISCRDACSTLAKFVSPAHIDPRGRAPAIPLKKMRPTVGAPRHHGVAPRPRSRRQQATRPPITTEKAASDARAGRPAGGPAPGRARAMPFRIVFRLRPRFALCRFERGDFFAR